MMCYTTVNTSLSLIPNLLNINTFVIEDIYEGNSYFCKFCSVFSTDAFILKNKLDWLKHGVVQLQYDYSHGIVPKVASRNKLIWVQYLCWDEVTASYKLDNRFVMSCHLIKNTVEDVLLDIQSHFRSCENDHARDSRQLLCSVCCSIGSSSKNPFSVTSWWRHSLNHF